MLNMIQMMLMHSVGPGAAEAVMLLIPNVNCILEGDEWGHFLFNLFASTYQSHI